MPKQSKNSLNFCSIDPPFPETGYAIMMIVKSQGAQGIFVPVDFIVTDLSQVEMRMRELIDAIAKYEETVDMPEGALLLPLQFVRRYPLRKEFWQSPSEDYSLNERMVVFMNAASNPHMHELIVTPVLRDDVWEFTSALPIRLGTADATIEKFMFTSKWVVSEEAKYAGIYSLGSLHVYYWRDKHLVIADSQKISPKKVN